MYKLKKKMYFKGDCLFDYFILNFYYLATPLYFETPRENPLLFLHPNNDSNLVIKLCLISLTQLSDFYLLKDPMYSSLEWASISLTSSS